MSTDLLFTCPATLLACPDCSDEFVWFDEGDADTCNMYFRPGEPGLRAACDIPRGVFIGMGRRWELHIPCDELATTELKDWLREHFDEISDSVPSWASTMCKRELSKVNQTKHMDDTIYMVLQIAERLSDMKYSTMQEKVMVALNSLHRETPNDTDGGVLAALMLIYSGKQIRRDYETIKAAVPQFFVDQYNLVPDENIHVSQFSCNMHHPEGIEIQNAVVFPVRCNGCSCLFECMMALENIPMDEKVIYVPTVGSTVAVHWVDVVKSEHRKRRAEQEEELRIAQQLRDTKIAERNAEELLLLLEQEDQMRAARVSKSAKKKKKAKERKHKVEVKTVEIPSKIPIVTYQRRSPVPTERIKECVCCMDELKALDVVFLPCKHMCACRQCSSTMNECPVCRAAICDRMTVFLA